MRNTTLAATASILIAAALLSSCTGKTGGNAEPTGSSDTSSVSGGLPKAGAPKVEHPVDTTKFQKTMCTTLTETQLHALGFNKPGESEQGPVGPTCNWSVVGGAGVTVTAITQNNEGISALYENRKDAGFFQSIAPIQGHPAVFYGLTDGRSSGDCGITVGMSDDRAFAIDTTQRDGSDPCTYTKKVAEQVVTTLKGGA